MPNMFNISRSPDSSGSSRSESPHSDEEHCRFIEDKNYEDISLQPETRFYSRIPHYSILIPWLLAIFNLGLYLHQCLKTLSEPECARLLSPYSPAIDAGIVEYYDTTFQNEFGGRSEYIGVPTPELEAKWVYLWSRGAFELPLDGPSKLNKSVEGLKHAHNDPNRGYAAVLEVFHQLHCLNQIRQYTWKDHYAKHMADYISDDNRTAVNLDVADPANAQDRMHVDHCIEALRLQLMCSADLTPLLIEVDESSELGLKTDFNVRHRCRRWDKITAWQDAHNLEGDGV
ncbi:hypothetical protein F4808DRAFT_194786 [Astrocystis sublimbata]|nr:hypothetical protein F4808DRAFT_194786 [Astrocystis sublimbata]